MCICASGLHTGGPRIPPSPHRNLYIRIAPLQILGYQNVYLCITVPYREEGGGLPKPPSPSPQPTGIYMYAWHSFLGHQMYSGIVHQRTDSAKTDKPSSGIKIVHQGTDYIKTNKAFPWHLSRSYQGTDYIKTDKPSPGTSLEVARGQTYTKTDKPSPGTSLEATRGQTTLSE